MSQQQVTIQITAKDGASQTFQAVGKAATGMSSTAQTAASKTTGSLNQISTSAKSTETAVGGIGRGFNVVTGAAAGLIGSAVVGFLSDSARAAAESEAVMARLAVAVDNTGASYDELAPRIDATVLAAQNLSFDDEDAADALATLTSFTGDASEAMDLLGVTMDIARGKGVSLASASQAVGKAATGQVAALSRMGVAVEEGATAQEALAAAQQTFAGQAEAYSNTTAGAFDRLTTRLGNFRESLGGVLGPAQLVLGILPGLSSGFSLVSTAMGGLGAAGGASSVLSAFGGSAAAALGPVALLGPAIAAVGIAAGVAALPVAAFAAAMYLTGDPKAVAAESFDEVVFGMDRLGLTADSTGTRLLEFARNYTAGTVTMLKANDERYSSEERLTDLLPELVRLDQALFDNLVMMIGPTDDLAEIYDTKLAPAIAATIQLQRDFNRTRGEAAAAAELQALNEDKVIERIRRLGEEAVATTDKFGPFIAAQERAAEIAGKYDAAINTAILNTSAAYDKYPAFIDEIVNADQHRMERHVAAEKAATEASEQAAREYEAIGRDIIATARETEQETVNAAESAADKIISAREREARGSLNAVESAGKAEVRAVEQAGDARIREATRIENKTVMAAEAAADSRVAAAESAEDRIVSAVETAADSRIASAQRAEDATVAAAERAATAQIQSATAAATAASQIVDQQVSAAEAAADRIVAAATQAASDAEAAANKDSEKEYDKKTDRANKHYDQAVRSAERSGGKITNDEQKRLNDMEKRRDQAIDRATDHQIQAEQEAARAREEAVRQAEARALAIREEAARQAAIAEEGIANKLELAKQAAAERTEAIATAAAERTAAVEAEQAAIVATAKEQAAANTAEVQKAANEDVELAARAAARATEIVRREAVRAVRNEERQTANEIRVINRTTAQIQRDEARSVAEATEEAADRRIAAENRVQKTIDDNSSRPGPGEDDPLDGPPARQLGGMVRREDVSQLARIYPTAAGGRTVLVGEAGPELAFLPYGTQVMPSTPSQSRMTSDSAGGGGMRFFGAVHIHAASPDIAREIERNLVTRSRA